MKNFHIILILLTTFLSGALHTFATEHNKKQEFSDSTITLGELSVSAIKQGANLEQIPVSYTSLSSKQTERLNILSPRGMSEVAPNFFIPDYGSRITSSIYVRGIGARIDQPVVGLNVDNVPILNKDNYDFNIPDIARMEMLRGPQSTLYGRNTMGGLINIYTISPLNYQGVRVMAEYGSGNTVNASAGYYARPANNLGVSAAINYHTTDGFHTNLYTGKKCDWEHSGGARIKVVWNPGNLNIENTAAFTVTRQGGYPYEYIKTGEINYNDTCSYRRNAFTDGLTIGWNIGKIKFTSISSVQYIDDKMTLDQDFLPKNYFTLTQKRKEWALTEDLLAKGNSGKYSWIAGIFGFFKSTDMKAPVTFYDYGIEQLIENHRNDANPTRPIRWDDRTFPLNSDFSPKSYGLAAYHQSDLKIGSFKLSAGLRLDWEQATLDYDSYCQMRYTIYHIKPGQPVSVDSKIDRPLTEQGYLKNDFLQLLPKITVSYNLPSANNSMVYASAGKGYKSGGFNTQMFSDVLQQRLMETMGLAMKYNVDEIVSYKPEKSWNFEIGAHLQFPAQHLNATLAAFCILVTDQQLTTFPEGVTTGRIMTNAGRSRSVGMELSSSWQPLKQWEITASYGLADARFTDFISKGTNYKGKAIPYAPLNTLFVGSSYTFQIASNVCSSIVLNANLRGVGRIYWDEANEIKQPFYTTTAASITFANKRYSLQIWGENILNTHYSTFYFVSISNAFLQRAPGARFGATLRLNF